MEIEKIEYGDKQYPRRLLDIKNPPKVLYVLGNADILNSNEIAIIGSRDCTKEGEKNARLFAINIAKAGFAVVSGMAKGIDAAAHKRSFGGGRKNYCSSREWRGLCFPSRK